MAKISQLEVAGPLSGAENMVIVQGGASKQLDVAAHLQGFTDHADLVIATVMAMSNMRETFADAIANVPVGQYFSTAETGQLRAYKRIAPSPFYSDLGDAWAPLTRQFVNPLSRNGTGVTKSVFGALSAFPATTAGGDDGPLVVLGSASGTDTPASIASSLIFTPRDNDVSGGVGYRNRVGALCNYSVILGGDNDLNALAVFAIGHHHRADQTIGAPSHPIAIGSYVQIGGAYGVGIGTNLNNFAIKAAIVGGDATRIGTLGTPENARNSFAGGGFSGTIDGKYAVLLAGQLAKATRDYSIAGGHGAVANTIGERVHASGHNGTPGDAYDSRLHLTRVVTGAGATELLAGGAARATVGSKTQIVGSGKVSAIRTDVEGETASWKVEYTINNLNGTLEIKSQTITPTYAAVASGGGRNAWVCDLVISAGRPALRVRGEGSPLTVLSCSATLDEVITRKL